MWGLGQGGWRLGQGGWRLGQGGWEDACPLTSSQDNFFDSPRAHEAKHEHRAYLPRQGGGFLGADQRGVEGMGVSAGLFWLSDCLPSGLCGESTVLHLGRYAGSVGRPGPCGALGRWPASRPAGCSRARKKVSVRGLGEGVGRARGRYGEGTERARRGHAGGTERARRGHAGGTERARRGHGEGTERGGEVTCGFQS